MDRRPSDTSDPTFFLEEEALVRAQHPAGATVTVGRLAPPEPPASWHGTTDAWVDLEVLGRGGMGTVHAARDRVLDRVVALKRPIEAHQGGALVEEALTLARIDHPNVVPVHALAVGADGAPVVVMKRVDGQRWSDLLAQGRDLERDVGIALEVADALRYAHARHVFHLDVKPDNVMVGPFGEVYLMDWGCAASGENATATALTGTPAYLAPEMLRRGAAVGPTTDVFLLGATLHRAVTGEPRHAAGDLRAVLDAARAARPAAYPPEVPADLGAILNRACAADPAERFPTIDELAAALRAFLRHREAAALADAALARGPELARVMAEGRGTAAPGGGPTAIERGAGGPAPLPNAMAEAAGVWSDLRGELRAALRVWPGNTRASEGLDALARSYLDWLLAQGELGAAEGVLDALLPEHRAAAAQRIGAARAEAAKRAAEARSHDLDVAARERLLAIGIVVGGTVVGGGAFQQLFGADGFQSDELLYIAAYSAALVLLAVGITWRSLAGSVASKRVLTAIVAMATGQMLHRGLAWYTDTPVPTTLLAEMVWLWCLLGIVGLFSEPGLVLSGFPFLAAALVIVAQPAFASEIVPVAMGASAAISLLVMHRRAKLASGEGPGRG